MVGLPRELAWVVMLFLPTVDLVRCLRVCRYFRLLLEGRVWPHEVRVAAVVLPPLWVQRSALDVRVDTVGPMNNVDVVIASLGRVTRLRIVDAVISTAVTFPEQLQELELYGCNCVCDAPVHNWKIHLPLSLKKYRVRDCAPAWFFWVYPDVQVPLLESLVVSRSALTGACPRPLMDFQAVCRTRIRVVGFPCNFEDVLANTQVQPPNPHLQELTLFQASRELPSTISSDLQRLFPNLRVLRVFNHNGALVPVHQWRPAKQLLEVDRS